MLGGRAFQSESSCALRIRDANFCDPRRCMRARMRGTWTMSTPMPRIDMVVVTNQSFILSTNSHGYIDPLRLCRHQQVLTYSRCIPGLPRRVRLVEAHCFMAYPSMTLYPSLTIMFTRSIIGRSRYQRPRDAVRSRRHNNLCSVRLRTSARKRR